MNSRENKHINGLNKTFNRLDWTDMACKGVGPLLRGLFGRYPRAGVVIYWGTKVSVDILLTISSPELVFDWLVFRAADLE